MTNIISAWYNENKISESFNKATFSQNVIKSMRSIIQEIVNVKENVLKIL